MSLFEITIQHKVGHTWPVVARYQPGDGALTQWSQGKLRLDLDSLNLLQPTSEEYGLLLGKALFRREIQDDEGEKVQEDIRGAFGKAVDRASENQPLRVLLIVEDDDLRSVHWGQLCAPLGHRWNHLLLNQRTLFSLYLPSRIPHRFPPIGRRDLSALLLVAGPEDLAGDYGLAPFDVKATVEGIQQALGEIPCQVLASVEGASGPPSLDVLCKRLTSARPTLLHIVCHGDTGQQSGEPVLYFPAEEGKGPVQASTLLRQLGELDPLPRFTFLSACESADPQAESGLGGLGQSLVRKLGMPAVVAMTYRITIVTAESLASAFYARLREHGEVDRALGAALAGLQGRHDVTVPALFSRLGERALWSDDLARPLTEAEIEYGLDRLRVLLLERAPTLRPEFETEARTVRHTLAAGGEAISTEAGQGRFLAAVNELCGQALDLSFNALALGRDPLAYDARPPFRGLLPFGPEDREFFFGRGGLVDKLGQQLADHPFLAVLGPSGSGKSSLVLAGLVPALQERDPRLRMAYLKPGSDPTARLEAALALARSEASEGTNGDSGQPSLVVVVDQFEELFTLCDDPAQRRAFVDHLLALLPIHRLLLTMRAGFWGDCAGLGAFKDQMQAHQELVAPLDAASLRRVMERQADAVGLDFEAGLSHQILEDVQGEPGAMPLLQHALLQLWNQRLGRWLRWQEYLALGRIHGAIAHTAEKFYGSLSRREQDRVRDILLRLARLGGTPDGDELRLTRHRLPLSELVPAGEGSAETRVLVRRLADERLLVTSVNEGTGQREAEVAHEALIQHWPRLGAWLKEDPELARLRQELGQAARDWRDQERNESYLLTGTRLEDLEVLHRQGKLRPTHLEQEYLTACVALRKQRRREEIKQAHALAEQERLRAEAELQRAEAAQQLAKEQKKRADDQAEAARRLRRRGFILAVALGAAVILAIAAGLSGKVAVDNAATATANLALAVTNEAEAKAQKAAAEVNAQEAQRQARLSHIGELAALALSRLGHDLDLALLLSIEIFQEENLLQTRQALFETWRHNPHLSRCLQGHHAGVQSVTWSAAGRLASGSADGTVVVWDLSPVDARHRQPAQTLEGHSDQVMSVAWSKDGQLASGSADGTVIVWDLERGEPDQILELEGDTGPINSVAWSKGGQLASGSEEYAVIIWDLERGEPDQTLEGHSGPVNSVAWSSDGRLASASSDETIIIWDLEKGQPANTLEGHSSQVESVAWSEGGWLASGSADHTVIVWDLEKGKPAQILEGHSGQVSSVAWSTDGQLASGSEDLTIIIWNLEREVPIQTLEGHRAQVWGVTWSDHGRLASSSEDDTVIIWSLAVDSLAQSLRGQSAWVWGMAWSSTGQLASGLYDGTVIVWDMKKGEPAQIMEEHTGPVNSVAWSADGRLASGSGDERVIVWQGNQRSHILEGHDDQVLSVAWSADGQLASGSADGTVIVWDLERDQPSQILRVRGRSSGVRSVAWSVGGRLASGSDDRTVIVWDLGEEEPEKILKGHNGPVNSVAWSADGMRLASASSDETIILWNLEEGQPAKTLDEHSSEVKSVAWSADGWLASGSEDRTVFIWHTESELPAHILQGHGAAYETVVWSADGKWLAMGLADGAAQVWPMDPSLWIQQACERAGRNLAQREWTRYFPGEEYHQTCGEWVAGD
jgi:WD40 repeat protein